MDDRSDTLCPKCGSPPPSVSGCMADDCPSQEIIDMMCQPPANQPVNNSSTIVWHLMVFDSATEKLVTAFALTESQIAALKPYLGVVDTDDHFGSYPVAGLDWFAEEHVGSHD